MATEDAILDRVQKLLAIADHPTTGEHEREVALAQANSLISKHAIDEALLRASQTMEQRRAPEKRSLKVASGTGMGAALSTLRSILHDMGQTYRVSVAISGLYDVDLYGAAEDVAWVEVLFTSTYFQLASKINPSWDSSKSYDENVYNFKVAGFKWTRINDIAIEHGGPDARMTEKMSGLVEQDSETGEWKVKYGQSRDIRNVQFDHTDDDNRHWGTWERLIETGRRTFVYKISGSMITAYRRHAAKIGDTNPVATQSHEVYRLSFIQGFQATMSNRLWAYRREMEAQMDTIPGAALAIADMTEEARQMMYGDHPELDPEEQRRQREQAKQDYADKLAAMTDEERTRYLEAEEREARRRNKPRKVKYYDLDDSAARRGGKAAEAVNMNRSAGATEAASGPRKELA